MVSVVQVLRLLSAVVACLYLMDSSAAQVVSTAGTAAVGAFILIVNGWFLVVLASLLCKILALGARAGMLWGLETIDACWKLDSVKLSRSWAQCRAMPRTSSTTSMFWLGSW